MSKIRFENIHKSFGDNTVLRGVTLDVEPGSILFVVGQSGAGKSVLVKHLIGLHTPDRGRIYWEGQDITDLSEKEFYPIRKKCAMVFQNSTLFDSMTLLENVVLPIRKHTSLSGKDAEGEARKRLAQVDMEEYRNRYPADFGDGMRKKVAIARALTLEPEFVIFDEPTTGIDPLSATIVDELIHNLSEKYGVTSIVISHDLRSIFGVADRIAMLYHGDLIQDGPPSAFKETDNPIVRQFIHGEPDGPLEAPE
jgi:phospholipid/cholesterol/gamma-HCH transport system ATP-binding protein